MSLQYVIDGYNLTNHPLFIRRHKEGACLPDALISFIKNKKLAGSGKNKIIAVFDGYPKPEKRRADEDNAVILFSRNVSADEKIKKIVEGAANRKNIIVVSDDRELKFAARSLGARVLGIEEFIRAKEKRGGYYSGELPEAELTYSQMHKINEELRRVWLGR